MKSHGKSKAVLTAIIFEVNLLQSSRFGDGLQYTGSFFTQKEYCTKKRDALFGANQGFPPPPLQRPVDRGAVRRDGGSAMEAAGREGQKHRLNYQYYKKHKWGIPENYHFCRNSSRLGLGRAVAEAPDSG